ncbi:MAG TPA: bifunctional DNA primase/polymerase [Ilumatobacteraceae bacterium]|jgi:hypothetical protein|nr:bifunctional DNA primase/polymerase [Ilumatobacteraceae bacterium]
MSANIDTDRLLGIYDAAIKLAQRGYRVFPCRYGTKLPATTNGFHDASHDPQTVKAWFGGNRLFNLALATGRQPNRLNVVVFDLDVKGEHNGIDSWERACQEGGTDPYYGLRIHATPTGGLHLFMDGGALDVRCMTNFLPGVDVRADGGYVLLPPSVILDRGTGEITQYAAELGLEA